MERNVHVSDIELPIVQSNSISSPTQASIAHVTMTQDVSAISYQDYDLPNHSGSVASPRADQTTTPLSPGLSVNLDIKISHHQETPNQTSVIPPTVPTCRNGERLADEGALALTTYANTILATQDSSPDRLKAKFLQDILDSAPITYVRIIKIYICEMIPQCSRPDPPTRTH